MCRASRVAREMVPGWAGKEVGLLGSEAYTHARDTPESQVSSWYDAVDSMGAFPSQDNWLDGWSIWNTNRHPGFVSSEVTCPTADNTPYTLCGDITA